MTRKDLDGSRIDAAAAGVREQAAQGSYPAGNNSVGGWEQPADDATAKTREHRATGLGKPAVDNVIAPFARTTIVPRSAARSRAVSTGTVGQPPTAPAAILAVKSVAPANGQGGTAGPSQRAA